MSTIPHIHPLIKKIYVKTYIVFFYIRKWFFNIIRKPIHVLEIHLLFFILVRILYKFYDWFNDVSLAGHKIITLLTDLVSFFLGFFILIFYIKPKNELDLTLEKNYGWLYRKYALHQMLGSLFFLSFSSSMIYRILWGLKESYSYLYRNIQYSPIEHLYTFNLFVWSILSLYIIIFFRKKSKFLHLHIVNFTEDIHNKEI